LLILYHDTETTGLVQTALSHDHPGQPHLVQLGLILMDEEGKERAAVELVVKPNGYTIPEGAANVHGVTTELAHAVGVPLMTALSVFTQLRAIADELVAFNLPFDDLVMRAAIHRSGKIPSHPGPSRRTCAMTMATPVLALPPTARMKAAGYDKHKPPNLTEAYKALVDPAGFQGAHGALVDARACALVHQALLRREAQLS